MAMAKCKECKQEVSNKAKVCPHCGVKNPTITAKDQFVGAIILVVIIAGLWIWLSGDSEPEKTPEQIAAENAACRDDIECWGRENKVDAVGSCSGLIERLAQYDYEWTDGSYMKVRFFRWLDKKAGTITYLGDNIKFQNGFGAWQHYTYECDYAPDRDVVLDVRATPGRM